jgi:hypothetical protein
VGIEMIYFLFQLAFAFRPFSPSFLIYATTAFLALPGLYRNLGIVPEGAITAIDEAGHRPQGKFRLILPENSILENRRSLCSY